MKNVLLGLLLMATSVVYAAGNSIYPAVVLSNIKPVKLTESGGDEIYLTMAIYPSYAKSRFQRIPPRPMYWRSKDLTQISQLKVWQDEIPDGQSVTIVFGLMEHDAPPWNTDDIIGSLRLNIHNEKGKMVTKWSIPNVEKAPKPEQANGKQTFPMDMKGAGGHYQGQLTLEEHQMG